MERKLAAILSADVAGYSRLMGEDEEATIRTLTAYRLAGRYDEAIVTLQSAAIRNPDFLPAHLHLAICYSELGRDAEARAELAEFRRLNSNVSLEWYRRVMVFKDPASLERYLTALRQAGLK